MKLATLEVVSLATVATPWLRPCRNLILLATNLFKSWMRYFDPKIAYVTVNALILKAERGLIKKKKRLWCVYVVLVWCIMCPWDFYREMWLSFIPLPQRNIRKTAGEHRGPLWV